MKNAIAQGARRANAFCASPQATVASILLMVAWCIGAPFFHFSSDYQLLLNTVTTIISFVILFVITNAQKRDTDALNAKLDALLFHSRASNAFVGIEEKPDDHVARERNKLIAEAGS